MPYSLEPVNVTYTDKVEEWGVPFVKMIKDFQVGGVPWVSQLGPKCSHVYPFKGEGDVKVEGCGHKPRGTRHQGPHEWLFPSGLQREHSPGLHDCGTVHFNPRFGDLSQKLIHGLILIFPASIP